MKSCEFSTTQHRITRMGRTAALVLARPQTGEVAAVFDRSIYCAFGREYVCIGVESLGMCPLNAITTVPVGSAWPLYHFRVGMAAAAAGDTLRIGGLVLKMRDAQIWDPPCGADLSYRRIKAGVSALASEVMHRVPEDGLGRLMDPVTRDPLSLNSCQDWADRVLVNLETWLERAMYDPVGNMNPEEYGWQGLLGLGPGLTPSGDDLLGGVMLALYRLGQLSNLRCLSVAVAAGMKDRTSPISAAHLRSAMKGMGSEAVHQAMEAVVAGNRERLPAALNGIENTGHTSGWDALAGIAIVFRLWLEANRKRSGTENYQLREVR